MYPITYNFKKIALTNKVTATDNSGNVILYAHQKMLKLKEKILIYHDSDKSEQIGELQADRIIDFSPKQVFTNMQGQRVLSVKRRGRKSIWKANYEINDANGELAFRVNEDKGWVKVLDSIIGEVFIFGMFTGYFLNPEYNITNAAGELVGKIKKQPSFFESNYTLEVINADDDPEGLLPVATMTVITRERMRG